MLFPAASALKKKIHLQTLMRIKFHLRSPTFSTKLIARPLWISVNWTTQMNLLALKQQSKAEKVNIFQTSKTLSTMSSFSSKIQSCTLLTRSPHRKSQLLQTLWVALIHLSASKWTQFTKSSSQMTELKKILLTEFLPWTTRRCLRRSTRKTRSNSVSTGLIPIKSKSLTMNATFEKPLSSIQSISFENALNPLWDLVFKKQRYKKEYCSKLMDWLI